MEGLLYFWSIARGGLWWEGSLNGGITVIPFLTIAISALRNMSQMYIFNIVF